MIKLLNRGAIPLVFTPRHRVGRQEDDVGRTGRGTDSQGDTAGSSVWMFSSASLKMVVPAAGPPPNFLIWQSTVAPVAKDKEQGGRHVWTNGRYPTALGG
jgi:hypothetical protein